MIPIGSQGEFHRKVARLLFDKVFEGIGGLKRYSSQNAETRHEWLELTAIERQMVSGRTD